MTERWIITPEGGRPLVLPLAARDGGCQVIAHDTPVPAHRTTWAQRPEGALPTAKEYENREITLQVQLVPPTDQWARETHDFGHPATEAQGDGDVPGWTGNVRRVAPDGNPLPPMIADIMSTVSAVAAGRGTVRRVLDDGGWLDFDALDAETPDAPKWDLVYYVAQATTMTLKFTCAPFGRGRERLLGEATKSAGSRLLLVDGLQVPGDVPALARLEFSGATVAQQSLLYAIDQRTYPLEIAASSRLLPNPAVTATASVSPKVAVLPASPAGTPEGTWELMAYLRSAAGDRIALTGTYRVLARARTVSPAGAALRLRWSAGPAEGGTITNPVCAMQAAGWWIADLGVVTIPDGVGELDGVIEWRGVDTTALRALDVLMLVPAARSGRAFASNAEPIGGTVIAADTLVGTGTLNGSAVQAGGTWSAAGTTGTGFVRTATGAFRQSGRGNVTVSAAPIARPSGSVSVRARFAGVSDEAYQHGLAIGNAAGLAAIASGSSASSGAWAVGFGFLAPSGSMARSLSDVVVDGTSVTFGTGGRADWQSGQASTIITLDLEQQPVLPVRVYATATPTIAGEATAPSAARYAPALPASPGQLYVGVWARGSGLATNGLPASLAVSNLFATAPTPRDRALHPNRTAQFTSSATTRDTPAGPPGPMSAVVGDRPFLPPSGRAGTPARVVLGTSRMDLRTSTPVDDTADTFTGRVFATPRYLQLPDQNA